MDVGRIAVRVIVAYVYLLVTTRGSGKRVVAQATPFDFVVAIIIGDLFDDAIWAEVSLPKFAAGVGSIFLCDALMKLGAQRWDWVLKLATGSPTAVLRDGYEDGRALRGEQLNEADLAHLLRLKGIEDWSEVHLGLVERDHEVSVIRKPEAEPAQKKDAVRVVEMMS
jgi:uncharacterized membrane protein YcaP (DUF421 family)